MKTEIGKLKKYRVQYENPKSEKEFKKASEELGKIHDKYGSIEISIVNSLIN
tara:strand:- start:497 stop:652 length:156 start_codon:yes stop_codon:yes gene_type:complete